MKPQQLEQQLQQTDKGLKVHSSAALAHAAELAEKGNIEIRPVGSGNQYLARVYSDRVYRISIALPKGKDPITLCDCSVEPGHCDHAAAGLTGLYQYLLEERQEHGSAPPSAPAPTAVPSNPKPTRRRPAKSALAKKVDAEINHELNSSQKAYLRSVQETYTLLNPKAKYVSGRIIRHLTQRQTFSFWQDLQLWEEFPENDHEFWLYFVHFAQQNGITTPAFMKPVSDTSVIAPQLTRWERNEKANKWTQFFQDAVATPDIAAAPPLTRSLRLRFDPERATLEHQEHSDAPWKKISNPLLRTLKKRLESGTELGLDASSTALLRELEHAHPDSSAKASFSLQSDIFQELLPLLLRAPQIHPCLITPLGKPFEIPNPALQWVLHPKNPEVEAYPIDLARPNGEPIGPILAKFWGPTAYYMTETEFLAIPKVSGPQAQSLTAEAHLPAPAVEKETGLEFLGNLTPQLPPKLEKKVERVPLTPCFHCYIDNETREECRIGRLALGPKGERCEYWDGSHWTRIPEEAGGPAPQRKRVLIPDRSQLDLLEAHLLNLPGAANVYEGTYDTAINRRFPEVFAEWLENLPPTISVVLEGELATFRDPKAVGRMRLQATEIDRDWFNIQVVLDLEDTQLTQSEIDLLLAANGKWVRLPGKGWRRLELKLDEDGDRRFAELGLNPKTLNDEPQRLHALQLAKPAANQLLPQEEAETIERRAADIQTRVQPKVPRAVQGELRPYQVEGFHFLAYLATNGFGGILADDMGLGKTVQTLTWLTWLRAQKGKSKAPPSLVVCPKSVMDNWRVDSEKFTPKLNVRVWSADTIKKLPDQIKKADLHVINYHQLRSIGAAIESLPFLAIILDEGQNIKNPNSETARTARRLSASHRLVLTGTPIENRALDLWSLMAFAMPGVLGPQAAFARLYDDRKDPLAPVRLAARVRPFLIRRTKSQVAQDLPERIEDEIHCELEGPQRKLYDAELKHAQQTLLKAKTQKQLNKLRFNFLTSLLRLRQICCHPKLYHEKSRTTPAKVTALLELLEPMMAEGAKVLVFSQFAGLLDLLKKALNEAEIPTWLLKGDTEDRGTLVEEFQSAPHPGVFLISLKAGGAGLNLTAASYVVLFDPWWNPAVEAQAIDRTHRIGQTNQIIAYRLIVKDTIEEKIRALQKEKKDLMENVLGEEQFSQSLTLDDFRYLLGD